jgi:hypothetical protein
VLLGVATVRKTFRRARLLQGRDWEHSELVSRVLEMAYRAGARQSIRERTFTLGSHLCAITCGVVYFTYGRAQPANIVFKQPN